MVMEGITWASLKRNPALIPLYVIIGIGVAGCAFYTARLAIKNPDVAWRKNEAPYNEYANKQYKFLSPNLDYSTLKSEAPKYTD